LLALPNVSKYNQDYFIDHLLSALNQVRTRNAGLKVAPALMMHMHNTICHKGAKAAEKMSLKGLGGHSIKPTHQISTPVSSGHFKELNKS
jgi:hypothetical protein